MRYVSIFIILLLSIPLFTCHPGKWILIDQNRSAYRIVIPQAASPVEQEAASELQLYLERISGVSLPVVSDSVAFKDSSILLGNNRFLAHFGMAQLPETLDEDGFVIRNEGPTLIIAGGKKKGTLYGVYTLLEDYLDCRYYAPDAVVVPEQETVRLPVLDVQQEPVFRYRETYHKFPLESRAYADWHKLHNGEDRSRDWGMWVHTFQRLVSHEEYYDAHPEYFSEINGYRLKGAQLCLSNPEVFDILVRNLRREMQENPEARYWSVSQNDNYSYCQCDNCRKVDEAYGSPSGSVLTFVNKVARAFPDKYISTLAYQYSRSAPAGLDPEENVNIMFCSIECNRSRPLETDPGEAAFRKDLQDWGAKTDNIVVWDYVVQFRNYLNPFPNLHVLQPNLQFFDKNHCKLMFQQGSSRSVTEFYELRTYLIAKLLWNPYIELDAVMDDFLNGYYGPAGPYLREYIDIMHESLVKSGVRLDIYGYPYDGINSYLTPDLLKRYAQIFDRAEAVVAGDSLFSRRVDRARLPLEFAVLDISLHNVNDELSYFIRTADGMSPRNDLLERVEKFAGTCEEHGIRRLEEHGYAPGQFRDNVFHLVQKAQGANLAFGKPVSVRSNWSEKYPVGGAAALTDGLYGTLDYHYNWLGFEDEDLEAVVDLGELRAIQEIKADFLRLHSAWIFFPRRVQFELSADGKMFHRVGEETYTVNPREGDVYLKSFGATFDKTSARYVRLKAESIRTCPDWHPGSGGKAWIFTDEIVVR